MTYERLDKACRARVLAVTDDQVLMEAFWSAQKHDEKRFNVRHGVAQNIVHVSKSYFEKKYGVVL